MFLRLNNILKIYKEFNMNLRKNLIPTLFVMLFLLSSCVQENNLNTIDNNLVEDISGFKNALETTGALVESSGI